MNLEELKGIIRDIPDFPQKGILFKDITPLLKDANAFCLTIDKMTEYLKERKINYVVGMEARGFIFGSALAYHLQAGFVPVRKKGKLPAKTESISYALEYGEAVLEIHHDALHPGAQVAIVDDLLATGGTAWAAAQLVKRLQGQVNTLLFVIELGFLKGREKLKDYDVWSLLRY